MINDNEKVYGIYRDEATPENALVLCLQARRVLDECQARFDELNAKYKAELAAQSITISKLKWYVNNLETYRKTYGSLKKPQLVKVEGERYNPEKKRFERILKYRCERWDKYTRRTRRYYEFVYEYRDPETQRIELEEAPEDCDFI